MASRPRRASCSPSVLVVAAPTPALETQGHRRINPRRSADAPGPGLHRRRRTPRLPGEGGDGRRPVRARCASRTRRARQERHRLLRAGRVRRSSRRASPSRPGCARCRQLIAAVPRPAQRAGAIVPFETNVKNVWPPAATGQRFARADGTSTPTSANLQSAARARAPTTRARWPTRTRSSPRTSPTPATDNPRAAAAHPLRGGLPHRRHAVSALLGERQPEPATPTPTHPELTWADSLGAGDFCNLIDPDGPDAITGFVPGTDRNQNYQLFSYVDQLMELKQQYNVGDIRLHTVLLFNEAGGAAPAAPICQDIYGVYPNTAPAEYPAAAKKIATWLLQQMAAAGQRRLPGVRNGDIQNLGLGALDYSSLASKNVMKTLHRAGARQRARGNGRAVDSDGDGLPDELDNSRSSTRPTRSSPTATATASTTTSRSLHPTRASAPRTTKDVRGCDPPRPLTRNCVLPRHRRRRPVAVRGGPTSSTRPGLVDSDGDGIPDGLEARYGLDPLDPNCRAWTPTATASPTTRRSAPAPTPPDRDRDLYDRSGYQYSQLGGGPVRRQRLLRLRREQPRAGDPAERAWARPRQGYNLFKVWFAEAPESGVSTDYGVWRMACAWAQYDAARHARARGSGLHVDDATFLPPNLLISDPDYLTRCVGTAPGAVA